MEVPTHQVIGLSFEYFSLATMQEKKYDQFLVDIFSEFSLCTNVLCKHIIFLQKWADTVYVVLKTGLFFIIIFRCTMNISSMHMGENPPLKGREHCSWIKRLLLVTRVTSITLRFST